MSRGLGVLHSELPRPSKEALFDSGYLAWQGNEDWFSTRLPCHSGSVINLDSKLYNHIKLEIRSFAITTMDHLSKSLEASRIDECQGASASEVNVIDQDLLISIAQRKTDGNQESESDDDSEDNSDPVSDDKKNTEAERGKKNTESVLGVVDFYGASAVTWSVIAQTQCHYQIHPTSLLFVL